MKGQSMKRSLIAIACILSLALSACSRPAPVETRKAPRKFVEFGTTRIDDYYWLNDPSDSTVVPHLEKENAYTAAMLAQTEGQQKKIYDELVGRIDPDQSTLPVMRNGYWYYTRYEKGQQYPYYCRKAGTQETPEQIFLNVPQLATGHQIFMVRGYSISRNNMLVAFASDTAGDRKCLLTIRDLVTKSPLPDAIGNTSGSYEWANDGRTLWYVLNDPTVRAYRVMRHVLGTDPAADQEVYAEKDSTFGVSLSSSRDHAFIFIASSSTLSSEWRFLSADRPTAPPTVIQPRQPDMLYGVTEHADGHFFITTNKDAKNFKLVSAPVKTPGMSAWTDVLAHRPEALLDQAEVLSRYIVAQYRTGGLTTITVRDRKSGLDESVPFTEPAYVAGLYTATDAYDLDSIRYTYTSLTTPHSEYRYDIATKTATLLKRDRVSGFNPGLYTTQRLWVPAGGDLKVPVSIVFRTDRFKHDGSNPLFLYAYGSYGANSDPYFNSSVVSLLDRGFVFGIAHIRGGQEMGRQWYEDGKVLTKKHTFEDFVACAQYLVTEKYTSTDRLFANGGSAGGMLMGAVINMRPDLFRGVIAEVPWMDVITDMENPDLPLTTLEYDEWGNPANCEHYEYMITWSPYDNVKDARYPAILATGGLHDTQVPYFSPAKWVAKVREHNTGGNPVLFKVNMGAGHSGESGRFERQKLTALKYAFMLDLLGIKD
jgi:oligopeptidase B